MPEVAVLKKLVFAVATAIWLAFIPLHTALMAVIALPAIDLVLGLLAAKRQGERITSAGLKRTVAKIALYEVATVLAFIVETWLTGPMVPAVKVITGMVGITELKSCLEHLDVLGGSPLFAAAIQRLAPPPIEDPASKE